MKKYKKTTRKFKKVVRKKKGKFSNTIKKIKLSKKKIMNGGVFWNEKLSPEEQVLANRTLTGYKSNAEVKECSKYKDKIVDLKYNLLEIPYNSETFPIKIFKSKSNFEELENGIHNFILFWDADKEEYILATSLFNAYEFAGRHYMLSQRLANQVPPQFIISGELRKINQEEPIIEFHDTSSLFFESNPNFKKSFLVTYLKQFSDENSELLKNDFIEFKKQFLDSLMQIGYTFFPPFIRKYNALTNIQQIYILFKSDIDSYKPIKNEPKDYILFITELMNDAINIIFNVPLKVVFKDIFTAEEYGEQINKTKFFKDMCAKNYSFNYFDTLNACNDNTDIKGNTCDEGFDLI